MVINAEFLDSLDTGIDQSQSMLLATDEAELGQASIVNAGACGAVARAVNRAVARAIARTVARAVATCKVHLSVDQIVVRWWSNGIFVCEVSPHHALKYGKVVPVVVVVKRYGTKIDVICVIRWAMYYLLTCQN